MIKTRINNVKSSENEEIIIAIAITKTIITVVMKIITIIIKTKIIKIVNRLKI